MSRRPKLDRYFQSTEEIDEDKVAALEQRVQERSSDVSARARLVRHYMLTSVSGPKRTPHALWFIKHHPGYHGLCWNILMGINWTPADYLIASELFQRHLKEKPGRASIVRNAANFYHDLEPDVSEQLYLELRTMSPTRARTREELGSFYLTEAECRGQGEGDVLASRALSEFEAALNLQSRNGEKLDLFTCERAASAAFLSNNLDKAVKYSITIIDAASRGEGQGISSTNAFNILGRVSVKRKEFAEAEKILLRLESAYSHHLLQEFVDAGIYTPVILALQKWPLEDWDPDRTKRVIDDLKKGNSASLAHAWFFLPNRASKLLALGRKEEAKKYYDLAKPQYTRADASCLLARLAHELGETTEAVRLLKQAYSDNPQLAQETLLRESMSPILGYKAEFGL